MRCYICESSEEPLIEIKGIDGEIEYAHQECQDAVETDAELEQEQLSE